ncbi:MAG: TIGR00268 family protein [Elusimicrobia bacterium RIFOXYA2_FULL_50_26]|nr:MAG: TIGR00268 family protein [Elusimicrobia bacterium RIFOXYA2_FULL_50_26]
MNKKWILLKRRLERLKKVLIAYSGGVDSTFLAAAARKTLGRENVLAVTAVSETFPAEERNQATALAKKLDINHIFINTDELEQEQFRRNEPDRCFHCKNELFKKLARIARQHDMALCDASNFSDRADYRPGRRAATRWNVISPLEDARFTKADVRKASRALRLPTWNQPAQACLASRVPFGTPISAKDLARIEAGELALKKEGFFTVRLRHHGDTARIETDAAGIERLARSPHRAKIARRLHGLGWRYVTLDLDGYRTGSLNPVKKKKF